MSELRPDAPKPARDDIEARAANFLQRQRFWNWSEADQDELEAWLAEAMAHRIAYLRLGAGLERMERLAALRPPSSAHAAQATRGRIGRWLREWVSVPVIAYAATAAALALAANFGMPYLREMLRPADVVFSTEVGGRALVSVADGTRIELNTNTSLRTRITTQERIVFLDKGEADFKVAHNAAHPFTVVVGHHRITDLGTEFLVRREPNGLEVTLLKGRAALSVDGGRYRTAMLTPGDDAVATLQAISVTRKTDSDLANALAWQRGVVVFKHTPLGEAVLEFNRYNKTKLVIADPAVARLTIGGEFRTDNLDDFLNLAQAVLRLRVTKDGNDIMLSRK